MIIFSTPLPKSHLQTINDSDSCYDLILKHQLNTKFNLAWRECQLLIEYVRGDDSTYIHYDDGDSNSREGDVTQVREPLTINIKLTSISKTPTIEASSSNSKLSAAIALGKISMQTDA